MADAIVEAVQEIKLEQALAATAAQQVSINLTNQRLLIHLSEQLEFVFMSDPVVLDEPEETIIIVTPGLSGISLNSLFTLGPCPAAFTDPAIVSTSGPVHAATQAAPTQSSEPTAPATSPAAPAQQASETQKVVRVLVPCWR